MLATLMVNGVSNMGSVCGEACRKANRGACAARKGVAVTGRLAGRVTIQRLAAAGLEPTSALFAPATL